ncbi:hypothetical protein KFE98_17730 [bacterium SCSIO 12741]|nr:hypothetical protein KFE98_17730 [bacterium SCSIO 12741]
MEKLISQSLDQYFSDFKEYHLIILIGFTVIIALIQIIQSMYVSKKIERFKNALKKSEIKYSKYSELQITALRKIYHLLAKFQLANNLIFNSEPHSIGHTKFKERINQWIKLYVETASEFSREKLLLTPEIKKAFSDTIGDFDEIKSILIYEANRLDYFEMEHQGNWNAMYEFEEFELDEINTKISSLKEKDSVKKSNTHIRNLREEIEHLFHRINQ